MCQCSCICTERRSSSPSSLALPFAPMFLFAPVPLSDPLPFSPPHSLSSPRSLFFSFPSRPIFRRRSLPLPRTPCPLPLSRNLSLPSSFPTRMNTPAAACGVNCHKACRSRLAVECRKRTKSISHEAPPALQARSYSFPPPANTPPSLQNTGERWFSLMVHLAKTETSIFIIKTVTASFCYPFVVFFVFFLLCCRGVTV